VSVHVEHAPVGFVTKARGNGLAHVLGRTAARRPDKVALIQGAQQFTFRELDQLVDDVAATFESHGVRYGDRVAMLSRNCWEFVAVAWGVARLGAVLVPLNYMLNADDVVYLLEDADVSAFVAEAELVPLAAEAVERLAGTRPLCVAIRAEARSGWKAFEQFVQPAPADWSEPTVADDDPIRIMYTSGTEARPKGAMLSSRALIAQYTSAIVDGGMDGSDVELHTLPLYHCAQLDCFLGPDIMLGATSIVAPSADAGATLAAIEQHRVTKYFAPPTVWIALLQHPDFDRTDTSLLQKGYYGASPMPVEVLHEIQRRLPDLRLWNFYGQTEVAPLAAVLPPHEQVTHAGAAGYPALNVETRIVDDDGSPVGVGVVGEIVHRTPQAMLGYWGMSEKTAEAFAGGWFHSGDLGVFDADGRLTVVDRKKDMIKSGGENVASREVEEVFYQHPDVAEVAVFATPDPRWVEAVTAVVVPRAGAELHIDDLMAFGRERLASFKRPKKMMLVEALPKNPSGKVLKRELRHLFD
jgi:fatty-acyl-CoA synthase